MSGPRNDEARRAFRAIAELLWPLFDRLVDAEASVQRQAHLIAELRKRLCQNGTAHKPGNRRRRGGRIVCDRCLVELPAPEVRS